MLSHQLHHWLLQCLCYFATVVVVVAVIVMMVEQPQGVMAFIIVDGHHSILLRPVSPATTRIVWHMRQQQQRRQRRRRDKQRQHPVMTEQEGSLAFVSLALGRISGSSSSSSSSSSTSSMWTSTTTYDDVNSEKTVHDDNDDSTTETMTTTTTTTTATTCGEYGPLSMTMDELAAKLGGRGRAQLVWDCYSIGVDPALLNYQDHNNKEEDHSRLFWGQDDYDTIVSYLPSSRRTQRLGSPTLHQLAQLYRNSPTFHDNKNNNKNNNNQALMSNDDHDDDWSCYCVEGGVAKLSHVSQSRDGTTKLLLELMDGLQVETVIIPWKGIRSTLCISSQVGCRQACQFCATGKMGLQRSLSSDEILSQMFWAIKLCRWYNNNHLYDSTTTTTNNNNTDNPTTGCSTTTTTTMPLPLPPITNVVFMGMGEPADNVPAVTRAVEILTTRELFQLSAAKVTVSTVAPTPDAFMLLGQSPCVLAWSVHAARDDLRRTLVPTTRYTMTELSQGLITALQTRRINFRNAMLEVVLIEDVNDSIDHDAKALVELSQSIVQAVPRCKLVVNLIPYNDISPPPPPIPSPPQPQEQPQEQKPYVDPVMATLAITGAAAASFRTPSPSKVQAFQHYLWQHNVYAHVRTTRGDDELAACGQLSTKHKHNNKQQQRRRQEQKQQS